MKPSTIRHVAMKNIGFPNESIGIEGDMRTCLAAIMNYWVSQTLGSRIEFAVFRSHEEMTQWLGGGSVDSKEAATLDELFNGLDYSQMVD